MVECTKKCPVPKEQRPENEYKALKKSVSFAWTASDKITFSRTTVFLLFAAYIGSSVILCSGYRYDQNLDQLLWYIPTFGNAVFIAILVRSYLGWEYVYRRLMQSSVSYEESGWYDGQLWVKPKERLTQDRLIGIYELLPILKRLKLTLCIWITVTIINIYTNNFILK